MHKDCLIEIGTEELAPRALKQLSQNFAALVETSLAEADLQPASVEVYATARRLAMLLKQTPQQQAEQSVEKRGPAIAAAFDDDGQPTRAALGFASSCGVDIDQLE